MALVYLDTSALAKWYLPEARSEDFESFIGTQPSALISRLTVLEFRCLLARRRRSRQIGPRLETLVFHTFEADVGTGFLSVCPLEDMHAREALEMLIRLKAHPLRTLDALHLAVARAAGASGIATADHVLAGAAATLGMDVVRFD